MPRGVGPVDAGMRESVVDSRERRLSPWPSSSVGMAEETQCSSRLGEVCLVKVRT